MISLHHNTIQSIVVLQVLLFNFPWFLSPLRERLTDFVLRPALQDIVDGDGYVEYEHQLEEEECPRSLDEYMQLQAFFLMCFATMFGTTRLLGILDVHSPIAMNSVIVNYLSEIMFYVSGILKGFFSRYCYVSIPINVGMVYLLLKRKRKVFKRE